MATATIFYGLGPEPDGRGDFHVGASPGHGPRNRHWPISWFFGLEKIDCSAARSLDRWTPGARSPVPTAECAQTVEVFVARPMRRNEDAGRPCAVRRTSVQGGSATTNLLCGLSAGRSQAAGYNVECSHGSHTGTPHELRHGAACTSPRWC
jgi:hypothetical protein